MTLGHKDNMQVPDQYQALGELPFPAGMQGLGLSMEYFKARKGDTEWYGPCPVHRPKANKGCFSYLVDWKFNCFACPAKEPRGFRLGEEHQEQRLPGSCRVAEDRRTRLEAAEDPASSAS